MAGGRRSESTTQKSERESSPNSKQNLKQRKEILERYGEIAHRKLEDAELKWWTKFLSDYAFDEIEFAFDRWLAERSGDEWWPTAGRITELCAQYRSQERQKSLPVGCERCDWTGWYETTGKTVGSVATGSNPAHESTEMIHLGKRVKDGGVEKLRAPCPCRADPSLRTPCMKRLATEEELRVMWTLVKEMCETEEMPGSKKKQVQKANEGFAIPTTKGLAEQLSKQPRPQRALVEAYRKMIEKEEK